MALPVIYKGSDERIRITLTDADGVALNPDDLEDIIVSVYQKKETPIQQWKLSDGDVKVDDADDGIVSVYLDRDNTKDIPEMRLFLEVIAELENTEFEDDTQRMIVSDIALADLKNSVGSD